MRVTLIAVSVVAVLLLGITYHAQSDYRRGIAEHDRGRADSRVSPDEDAPGAG